MVTIEARPDAVTLDPRRTAVLVVDMQNDFASPGGMFERAGIDVRPAAAAIDSTRSLLAAARDAGMAIVYLQMEYEPDLSDAGDETAPNRIKHRPLGLDAGNALIRDTWGTAIVDDLAPEPGDLLVSKQRYSGFFNTDLDGELQRRGITHLLVAGLTTSVCVESTVRDAMFRDYSCIVLEDCTAEPIGADAPRTNKDASLLVVETLFGWVANTAAILEALERQTRSLPKP
jgi:ureidoacrylate peracid hydrolase